MKTALARLGGCENRVHTEDREAGCGAGDKSKLSLDWLGEGLKAKERIHKVWRIACH